MIVFGVAPDQTDEVIDSWKSPLKFKKVTFFHLFKLAPQWLQMHAKVIYKLHHNHYSTILLYRPYLAILLSLKLYTV